MNGREMRHALLTMQIAQDADAADVADGVPGDWAHGQTACEPAGGRGRKGG